MNTTREIQEAIARLPRYEQEMLGDWIRDLVIHKLQIAEAALVYGKQPDGGLVSVEDYLNVDETSPLRHEYVSGRMYAMAGESPRHNEIATSLIAAFRPHLRGGPCRVFHSGVKLNFKAGHDEIFYCPDVMVVCGQSVLEQYVREPSVVVEVLSPSTERTDRREKIYNYREIPTLQECVLLAQHTAQLTLYRRSDQWAPRVMTSLEESVEFRSIGLSMTLAQIYEGIALT